MPIICAYGEYCHRRNKIHFQQFLHPHLERILDKGKEATTNKYAIPKNFDSVELISWQLATLEAIAKQESSPVLETRQICANPNKDINRVVVEKGAMAQKLQNAAPYNLFLTAVKRSPLTHHEPLSITMQEIFDCSLGEIESSAVISKSVNFLWLKANLCKAGFGQIPILIVHNMDEGEDSEEDDFFKLLLNIDSVFYKMPNKDTSFNSNFIFLAYTDGSMRIVVSTTHFTMGTWEWGCNGVWISPKLPPLSDNQIASGQFGESPTGFKKDLLLYFDEHQIKELQPWIERLLKCDFSGINVFFVGSVPGEYLYVDQNCHQWGHPRVGAILAQHAAPIDNKVPIICQSVCMGFLGSSIDEWLHPELLQSLGKSTKTLCNGNQEKPQFQMIYATQRHADQTFSRIYHNVCSTYPRYKDIKQTWLRNHLHQWKFNSRFRERAWPCTKTYTRFNFDEKCLYWFLLTSANLSRAGWGKYRDPLANSPLNIYNFEAGVLFLPRFVIGEETFPLECERNGIPPFPLPYDIPLIPYGVADVPSTDQNYKEHLR